MNNAWVIGHYTNPSNNYNDHILVSSFRNRNWNVKAMQFELIDINENNQLTYDGEVLVAPGLAVFSQPIFTIKNVPYYNKINQKLELLKQLNTVFINDIDAHCDAANKSLMYGALQSAAINEGVNCPIPMTTLLSPDLTDEKKLEIVELLGGFPVVFKNPLSTKSDGVYLIKDLEELNAKEADIRKSIYGTGIIVQQFIDMGGIMVECRVTGQDIKTRITLGSPYEDFKPNIYEDRSYVASETSEELREIALNAMRVLGLDLARVDFFYNEGKYIICEVNSIGSILGAEMAWNHMVGQDIVDYCISKYQMLKSPGGQ